MKKKMKTKMFLLISSVFLCSSCLSVLKADRLVYAGSVGKKIDAVLVDSVSSVDLNQSTETGY